MSNADFIAERLIATVARAFYSDSVVVLIDLLLREKCVQEEEIGPRLQFSAKEVRKLLTQLQSECFLKTEDVSIAEAKGKLKYYYIDYQTCVNFIRYRIHLIRSRVVELEGKGEFGNGYYMCPTCKSTRYTELEVLNLKSGDGKFICPTCCPNDDFRTRPSEAYYRLEFVDTRKGNANGVNLHEKLEKQFRKSQNIDYHFGIYDMLHSLKEAILSRNLPSENLKLGYGPSRIEDAELLSEVQSNIKDVVEGKAVGGSYYNKKSLEDKDKDKSKTITLHTSGSVATENVGDLIAQRAESSKQQLEQRDYAFPEFLKDSRVKRTAEVLKDAEDMQVQRDQPVGVKRPMEGGDNTGAVSKQPKVESSSVKKETNDDDWLEGMEWETEEF